MVGIDDLYRLSLKTSDVGIVSIGKSQREFACCHATAHFAV
jgi:hypothetical protein